MRPLPQTAPTPGAATGAACPAPHWYARALCATTEFPAMAIAPELRAQILRLYQVEHWHVGRFVRNVSNASSGQKVDGVESGGVAFARTRRFNSRSALR